GEGQCDAQTPHGGIADVRMTDAMRVVVLVPVPSAVVTCIRARSAARHNSARAPQRVLRRRRVRSCPLTPDASGGDDPNRGPARPHRATRLLKYLQRSLGEPAWRHTFQPWPGM